jgi:hypothetical protein
MRTAATILGFIGIIIWVLSAISYYTQTWGAIGFFGSILTFPVATVIYALISFLSDPVGTSLGIILIAWLLWWGSRI